MVEDSWGYEGDLEIRIGEIWGKWMVELVGLVRD